MQKIFLIVSFSFLFAVANAQQISFPTAEGMGKYTTGGRGTPTVATTVYEVTNLLDDNQPGCLRYAATKSGATYRTIVFRVSGTIHLTSKLSLNRPNTTIAGQSAPGDGICIADFPVAISTDNLIVRYIRFRLGDKNQNRGMVNGSGDDDAFSGTGHKNIIIDHCTMSWSNDESFTVYSGDSTTLQWNMISEPLNYSYHFETGDADFEHHGYGGIWGGKHTSAHHNLIAHVAGRGPRFDGSRNLGNGTTVGLENVDFRNNVIYDWSNYNVNGGEGGNYNVVNNYYKYGPSTPTTASKKFMTINPFKATGLPYGQYYLTGNYVDGSLANTTNNWLGALMDGTSGTANIAAARTASTALVAFPLLPIPDESAADAYNSVLKNVGCVLPNRDTLDQRIINDVINRTGKIIDVQGNYPAHSTNTAAGFAATVNAWPTLATAPAPLDSDHDGMPDEWEMQRGLNSNDATDRNGYNSNGYTNEENYLNGDTIVAYGTTNTCVNLRAITASSSGNWIYAKDSSYIRLISTDTNNIVAAIFDNANANIYTTSYFTTNTLRYDISNHPYLNRNITITPGNIIASPVTVRFYFTTAEYDSLKAADPSIASLSDLRVLKIENDNCPSTLVGAPEIIVPTAYGTYGTYQKGYYVEFTTNSFSTFFIGSRVQFPVPIKLTSFNASLNSQTVKTIWSTENELNEKEFIVERSNNQQNFVALGNIAANNNVSSSNNYNFTDTDPINGTGYYRLKIVDKDGTVTYSQTVSVNYKNISGVTVSPNPARLFLNIKYPEQVKTGFVNIFSSEGKKVIQVNSNPTTTNQSINISALPNGVYAIVCMYNNKSQTIRFIKN